LENFVSIFNVIPQHLQQMNNALNQSQTPTNAQQQLARMQQMKQTQAQMGMINQVQMGKNEPQVSRLEMDYCLLSFFYENLSPSHTR
jgi:hypothetical protein